jgi:hypothetical protein
MPGRMLKASYIRSERINACSTEARDLWIRLLVSCDDFGLFDARPAVVAVKCYPLDPQADVVTGLLDELEGARLILRYADLDRPYLIMRQWYVREIRQKEPLFPVPPDVVRDRAELCSAVAQALARGGWKEARSRPAHSACVTDRDTAVSHRVTHDVSQTLVASRARQTPSQAFESKAFRGISNILGKGMGVQGEGETMDGYPVGQKTVEEHAPLPHGVTASPGSKKVNGAAQQPAIGYDIVQNTFLGITAQHELTWAQNYPALFIQQEIGKAGDWLHANPRNAKKNVERFLVNWFLRAQERAARVK